LAKKGELSAGKGKRDRVANEQKNHEWIQGCGEGKKGRCLPTERGWRRRNANCKRLCGQSARESEQVRFKKKRGGYPLASARIRKKRRGGRLLHRMKKTRRGKERAKTSFREKTPMGKIKEGKDVPLSPELKGECEEENWLIGGTFLEKRRSESEEQIKKKRLAGGSMRPAQGEGGWEFYQRPLGTRQEKGKKDRPNQEKVKKRRSMLVRGWSI